MSTTVGTVVLDVKADTAKLVSGMSKAERTVKKSVDNIKRTVVGMAAAYAGIEGIRAFQGMIGDSINAADATGKLAEKLGISTEYLSKMQYAAGFAAVDVNKLDAAMSAMTRRVNNFKRSGGGAAAKALKELGITAEFAKNNFTNTEQTFTILLNKLSELPPSMEKTAIAQDLFSKSASSVLRVANLGSDAIAEYADEAERLGLVITGDMYDKSAELNDRLDRMGKRFEGVGNKITIYMLPALEGAVSLMEDMLDIEKKQTLASLSKEIAETERNLSELNERYRSSSTALQPTIAAEMSTLSTRLSSLRGQYGDLAKKEEDLTKIKERTAKANQNLITSNRENADITNWNLKLTEEGLKFAEMRAEQIQAAADAEFELYKHSFKMKGEWQGKLDNQGSIFVPENELEKLKELYQLTPEIEKTFHDWGDTLNSSISSALTDAIMSGDVNGAIQGLSANIAASMIQASTANIASGAATGGALFGMGGLGGIAAAVGLTAIGSLFGGDGGESAAERADRLEKERIAQIDEQTDRIVGKLDEQLDVLKSIGDISGATAMGVAKAVSEFALGIEKEGVFGRVYLRETGMREVFGEKPMEGYLGSRGYTVPDVPFAYDGANGLIYAQAEDVFDALNIGAKEWHESSEDYLARLGTGLSNFISLVDGAKQPIGSLPVDIEHFVDTLGVQFLSLAEELGGTIDEFKDLSDKLRGNAYWQQLELDRAKEAVSDIYGGPYEASAFADFIDQTVSALDFDITRARETFRTGTLEERGEMLDAFVEHFDLATDSTIADVLALSDSILLVGESMVETTTSLEESMGSMNEASRATEVARKALDQAWLGQYSPLSMLQKTEYSRQLAYATAPQGGSTAINAAYQALQTAAASATRDEDIISEFRNYTQLLENQVADSTRSDIVNAIMSTNEKLDDLRRDVEELTNATYASA